MFDSRGTPVYIFKNIISATEKPNYSILSHFLFALLSIAGKLEKNQIKLVEINDERFFIVEESQSNSYFVVKTNREASPKLINPILEEVKERFVKINLNSNPHKNQEKFESFIKEIEELLNH